MALRELTNCFVVEACLFCNRDDETWLTITVELIPVNQEVACKFMFITPFPLYLWYICEVLLCDLHNTLTPITVCFCFSFLNLGYL